jgi:alpha,alpha-trehalase
MARIYNDSKTFVDMKLKRSPDETLKLFDEFMAKYVDRQPEKDAIQKWVEENFEERGKEFENWIPDDFKKDPEILSRINDKALRTFAQNLNGIWLELGRKMKKDVADNPELYSIIYVENPVIVPGGRFLEFYYWDSYWIVRGLLLSEMFNVSHELFCIISTINFLYNMNIIN